MTQVNILKRYLTYMLTVVFATVLIGCDKNSEETAADPAESDDAQAFSAQPYGQNLPDDAPTYLVAVEAAYAPFAFRNEQGYVVGYDEDLLAAIGEVEGFRVKFIHQGWDGIFDTLADGTRDIVASGINLTDERLEFMDATDPIFRAVDALYVSGDAGIDSADDLEGKTISTQDGTSMLTRLKAAQLTVEENIKPYDTMYSAFRAVLAGEVDAVWGNSGVLGYYANNLPEGYYPPGINRIDFPQAPNAGLTVFYVDKGRTDLLTSLNRGLAKLKENGEYARINKRWFGRPDSL